MTDIIEAMKKIETIVNETALSAQQSAESSQGLFEKAKELNDVGNKMQKLMYGREVSKSE